MQKDSLKRNRTESFKKKTVHREIEKEYFRNNKNLKNKKLTKMNLKGRI